MPFFTHWNIFGVKSLLGEQVPRDVVPSTPKAEEQGNNTVASKSAVKGSPSTSTADSDDDLTLVHGELNHQIDYAASCFREDDPRVHDWTKEEIVVFNELATRGYLALLPESWHWDFPSFPDILFSDEEMDLLIHNKSTSVTEASNELNNLIQAGPRCRDALSTCQRPEPPLNRAILNFLRWSWRDARLVLSEYPPIVFTETARAQASTVRDLVHKITDKMQLGRKQWQNRLDKDRPGAILPTLFGFVIKYSVVAIVTLDAGHETKVLRTLVTLNFQEEGQDVWAALAIAIIAMHARRYVYNLGDETQRQRGH